MADREPLDEEKLKALISAEIRAADTFQRTELTTTRARNLEYYQGVMNDTPAMAGRSQVVSRDVADVMGWILPGIIRVFTASDRIAEYDPVGIEDEEFAKQATDYINFVFLKDNPGYRIMWDATHDSLLMGNGIVKHYWDDTEECTYDDYSGVTAEQIALLQQDGVEVLAQKPGEPAQIMVPSPDGQPMPQEVETFEIKTKLVTSAGRICIECIEPENFLKDKWSTTIEGARFVAHRDPDVTKSDLIEMGFPRDVVDGLQAWQSSFYEEEALARTEQFYNNSAPIGDESMTRIELFECYVKVDVDGDGKAETVRAYYASDQLLDWEVWDDDYPFSDIPCEPVPHRWDARSIADETVDVQRIKTVLMRQMLDNLYASNIPMREAEQGAIINPEMMISPKFGGIIWRKKGSAPTVPYDVPFFADKAMAGLEYFDQVIERRTGVSRATMALDPETLQNQTATANQNQRDAAYSQVELIARNQAEGWRYVFRALLKLAVKHQDRKRTIRLRNKWVEVEPQYWNADMDATVNVGLGTGSRDRDMAMLNSVNQTQVGIAQIFREAGAIDQAIAMIPKIVKTAMRSAESSGLRNPDDYYPELSDEQVQQITQNAMQAAAQPDPTIQAQMQIEQGKAQAQMQIKQAEMQMDAQLEDKRMQVEANKEQAQMEADLIVKREDTQMKAQLEQQKMVFEASENEKERAFKWQVELLKAQQAREQAERQEAQAERQGDRTMAVAAMNNQTKERAAKAKPNQPRAK